MVRVKRLPPREPETRTIRVQRGPSRPLFPEPPALRSRPGRDLFPEPPQSAVAAVETGEAVEHPAIEGDGGGAVSPISAPGFWTTDGDTFVTVEQMQADPDLRRRCLAWELAEVADLLSRTEHEPAFDRIRLAVRATVEEIGAAAAFRKAMRARQAD